MTILEAYRVLLSVEFEPVNDIEFHWYDLDFGNRKDLTFRPGTRQRKEVSSAPKLLHRNTRPKTWLFSLRFKYETITFSLQD